MMNASAPATVGQIPVPGAPADRAPFFFLCCFVATQGFLVPLFPLPVNWALWPNLPDLFGTGLVVSVLLTRRRSRLAGIDRVVLESLLIMLALFVLSFLLVTILESKTGEGIKFGGFTILLLAKYLAVFWAAAHVSLNPGRMRAIHVAALIAFLWLTTTVYLDKFGLLDLSVFVQHLPHSMAGKWSPELLDSTVSTNHGGTTVVILVLGALVLGTANYRRNWFIYTFVIIMGLPAVFLSGSRQGLIRFLTFTAALLFRKPWQILAILLTMAALATTLPFFLNVDTLLKTDETQVNLERQNTLTRDPFSDEGLSGRPQLWASVVNSLDEKPQRYFIGYGVGNYVEHKNAAHNMFLGLMQDGGVIALFVVSWCWIRIFRRIWIDRKRSWVMVTLTLGMLTSVMTSSIFYPNLATGWYLGLYFVCLHIMFSVPNETNATDLRIERQYAARGKSR